MPDLERYILAWSNWLFSRGLRTEKRGRNESKSWSLDLAKIKEKRTCIRADGVCDIGKSSRVDGIRYRPRHPKVLTGVLYQGK